MRRIILQSTLLLIGALILPLLLMKPAASSPASIPDSKLSAASLPDFELSPGAENRSFDKELSFTALWDGQAVVYTLYDYLPSAVAGEMPASFEPEALMAQAVAIRTYILYCTEHPKHQEAAVCNDPSCCKYCIAEDELRVRWGANFEAYWAKLCAAVRDTDGQCLIYDGKPIQAVFHSSSSGRTEESGNLWNPLPYLVSVSSPETAEDVPNYMTTVEVSADEFRRTVLESGIDLDGSPESWLGAIGNYESGRVAYITVSGVLISGTELRRMFDLRSTAFGLSYSGGNFVFTVTGYGHGVGLSQYGANVMAKQGAAYDEILSHYYPGTVLSQLSMK